MDLADQHGELLKQFRDNLGDLLTPDYTDAVLIKWLRVKKFDLKKAELNFQEVQWNRMTYQMDALVDTFDFSEEMKKYRGDTFLGFAKDGSLVRYITAKEDFYGFLQSVSTYNLILSFCKILDGDIRAIKEENLRTGRENNEITYVIDMEGYSLMQFTNKTVPFIYKQIFSLFKPILKDTLLGKIQFATTESTGELLRQYIDESVLPAFLGGERVDSSGDIYCREFIRQSGKIPEKYFLRNCMHYIDETDVGVNVVTIGARSVFNLPLILKDKGSQYRLEMRTEHGSLYFAILYRKFGPDPDIPDLPPSDEYLDPHDERCNVNLVGTRLRVFSDIAPIDGRAVAFNPGIYIMQFDNTESWFTSRKLLYRTTIYPPYD